MTFSQYKANFKALPWYVKALVVVYVVELAVAVVLLGWRMNHG